MRKQWRLGLVVEGSFTSSTIFRLPKLGDELGPVKAASVRVARRFCNMYHAGYPVAGYEDLQAANLILLWIPDVAVARFVENLCASELVFKELAFVLCESWLPSKVLGLLEQRGASTATLTNLPTTHQDWFAVEGGARAVRQTRRFLERNGARSNELNPDSKHHLFVSEVMTTALPLPNLILAQQALRASGFSGNILSALLEQMTLKMLQDFLRGARASWGGPMTQCSPEVTELHLQTLRQVNPDLAAHLDREILQARKTMAARPGSAEVPLLPDTAR